MRSLCFAVAFLVCAAHDDSSVAELEGPRQSLASLLTVTPDASVAWQAPGLNAATSHHARSNALSMKLKNKRNTYAERKAAGQYIFFQAPAPKTSFQENLPRFYSWEAVKNWRWEWAPWLIPLNLITIYLWSVLFDIVLINGYRDLKWIDPFIPEWLVPLDDLETRQAIIDYNEIYYFQRDAKQKEKEKALAKEAAEKKITVEELKKIKDKEAKDEAKKVAAARAAEIEKRKQADADKTAKEEGYKDAADKAAKEKAKKDAEKAAKEKAKKDAEKAKKAAEEKAAKAKVDAEKAAAEAAAKKAAEEKAAAEKAVEDAKTERIAELSKTKAGVKKLKAEGLVQ